MSTICTNNKQIERDQLHSMDGLGASISKQVAVGGFLELGSLASLASLPPSFPSFPFPSLTNPQATRPSQPQKSAH